MSDPIKVYSYRELVQIVARISYHNPDYSLFFRGQGIDYKLSSGASSFYPTIYRKQGVSLSKKELGGRFSKLDQCAAELIMDLNSNEVEGTSKLNRFPELLWSILQHYGVCGTPLLDVTHSLRVAASFAFLDGDAKAYLFIFALPYPQGTITYSVEGELLTIRLLSACPSDALRPHFQEGYLIGTFPSRAEKKNPQLDFGRRLIAKIELVKERFWDNEFPMFPRNALYPEDDYIEDICAEIQAKYSD
ncbi:MAG: FRG domain-containing protein [Anaerolineales bacterium]